MEEREREKYKEKDRKKYKERERKEEKVGKIRKKAEKGKERERKGQKRSRGKNILRKKILSSSFSIILASSLSAFPICFSLLFLSFSPPLLFLSFSLSFTLSPLTTAGTFFFFFSYLLTRSQSLPVLLSLPSFLSFRLRSLTWEERNEKKKARESNRRKKTK